MLTATATAASGQPTASARTLTLAERRARMLTSAERGQIDEALDDLETFIRQYREFGVRELYDLSESARDACEICERVGDETLRRLPFEPLLEAAS